MIDNSLQAFAETAYRYTENFENWTYANATDIVTWDNHGEGNYWSDYGGIDVNSDGVGDTPYIINGNNTDYYPLTESVAVSKPKPERTFSRIPRVCGFSGNSLGCRGFAGLLQEA